MSRTTYREVLAEPIFRVIFFTRSLSIAASTLRIVALSLLVFASTGSPLWTAIAFGIGFLPQVIGGTLFGSLSDRVPPRALITSGHLLECSAAVVLAVANLPVAANLLLVAAVAALAPIFSGAANRLIAASLVGEAYVLGRSLSTAVSAGAQLAGLAAGGLAVAAVGPRHALLVSAGCQLAAAAGVRAFLPRLAAPVRASGEVMKASWRSTRALLADRRVRSLLLIQWLPPAYVTGAEALVVSYVAWRGFSDGVAGLLLATLPAGMLVGHLALPRLVRPPTLERLVTPLLVVLGAPIAALALPLPVWACASVLFVAGAGFAYELGVARAFVEALPASAQGHGFGLLSTGLMTLQGVGPVVFGAVAQFGSIPVAMVVAGGATITAGLLWSWRA